MVKAVVHQAEGGEGRFPAGPRALLSWFQSGRKGLGSCNRFEELNQWRTLGGGEGGRKPPQLFFTEALGLKSESTRKFSI